MDRYPTDAVSLLGESVAAEVGDVIDIAQIADDVAGHTRDC